MNILSIDYGDIRIGLAYGSTEHHIAFPLQVLHNTSHLWKELLQIIQQYTIKHIIVGIPVNLEGKDTQQTQKVRQFIQILKQHYTGTIEEMDERFTSLIAKQYIPRGQSVDIESARILLEEWFSQHIT
jgi:putative Holliday junction resolvase